MKPQEIIDKKKFVNDKFKASYKVTIVGGIANILLSLCKFVAGVISSSSAMVADALHSISDLITDGVILVSLKITKQPADEDHPYGHGRAETISTLIVGAALGLVGIFIIIDTFRKIDSELTQVNNIIAPIAALLSIIVKELLYHYTKNVGIKYNLPSLVANAWHHRSDSFSSIAALIGIVGSMIGFPIADPIAACIVSLMIIKVGYDISKEAVKELMDASIDEEKIESIENIINSFPEIIMFHELRARKLGADIFTDIHIVVDPLISVSEAHNIAENLRVRLKEKANIEDALIHIDAEDDIHYKNVNFDRKITVENIKKIISDFNKVDSLAEAGFHILNGKMMADITLQFKKELSISEAQNIGYEIKQKIKDSIKSVDYVVVRAKLSLLPDETDFADHVAKA